MIVIVIVHIKYWDKTYKHGNLPQNVRGYAEKLADDLKNLKKWN